MKTLCKRLRVSAIGMNVDGSMAHTTNGNYTEEGCTGEKGNCGCVHAEQVLIKIMGEAQVVLLSHSPCMECAKILLENGVMFVLYANEYRKTNGIDYLQSNGVRVSKIPEWFYVRGIINESK